MSSAPRGAYDRMMQDKRVLLGLLAAPRGAVEAAFVLVPDVHRAPC
jgi:hypothetical protein